MICDRSINIFWPRQYFNSERRYSQDETTLLENDGRMYPPSWWFGQRNGCFVGLYCSKESTEDCSPRNDALAHFFDGDPPVTIPVRDSSLLSLAFPHSLCRSSFSQRRHTTHKKVYWVVVVGDELTHSNFDQFCSYCWRIEKTENVKIKQQEYEVTITPPGMDPISLSVANEANTLRL
jgi:hypothetical protein